MLDLTQSILSLIAHKEAIQFIDNLLGKDETKNHCIEDQALQESKSLNEQINQNLHDLAQLQVFSFSGLQAKARILKAIINPLNHDEASILLTSLLMDILAGVNSCRN